MRNKHQLPSFSLAPAASEFLTKLEKIDWALVLIGPSDILHLPQLWIDQD
jgi:hypothetical protein